MSYGQGAETVGFGEVTVGDTELTVGLGEETAGDCEVTGKGALFTIGLASSTIEQEPIFPLASVLMRKISRSTRTEGNCSTRQDISTV